jgi:hypothetical protein
MHVHRIVVHVVFITAIPKGWNKGFWVICTTVGYVKMMRESALAYI